MKTTQNDLLALDANQATISTATVTIRTLRVNNKQLTQAIFRQLPKKRLIDAKKPEIVGTVWGWVNYTPSGEHGDGRQFVAQFGEELCRCPTWLDEANPASSGVIGSLLNRYENCARNLIFLDVLTDHPEMMKSFKDSMVPRLIVKQTGFFGDIIFQQYGTYSMYDPSHWSDYGSHCHQFHAFLYPVSRGESKEESREKILATMKKLGFLTIPDHVLRQRMVSYAADAEAYAQRYNALIERLEAAPQLFIAV